MKAVLRYIKPFAGTVILAVTLLCAQAMGELTMPNLMSDIVNVGVQGGGITEAVPLRLTPQAMRLLLAFMPEDHARMFREAYDEDGNLRTDVIGQDLDAVYGRAVYAFMMKAMDAMRAMEITGVKAEQAEIELTEIAPEQLYQMGRLVLMANPDLQEELAGAEVDSQLYAQMAKVFTRIFYRDAGLDINKIQRDYIYKIGLRMVLLAMGCGIIAIVVVLLSARISAGFARNLRRSVFAKVHSFHNAEIDKFSTASLITRSTNDVQQVQNLILMGIRTMAFAPVMGVGGVIMAMRKSLSLSWIIFLAILILICALVLVMIIVMPRIRSLQGLIDKLNLVSRESLTGLMVVRAFGNEPHEEARFELAARNLARTERFVFRSMAMLMPLVMILLNGITMVVVWFGAKAIERSTLQIGDMMAFVQYAMNIVFSFMFIAMMFVMIPRAAVSANRIKDVLETENTILDAKEAVGFPAGNAEVSFDHVHFRYGGAEEDMLEDITFTAKPGQTTAFIGATGAGKSTLAKLLERFYDVTAGAITINGIDIREIRQADLRENIGFVPQQAVLFSGDIRTNVAYDSADLAEKAVREAIRVAQAEDFVSEYEDGLAARVAQGGSNLSGGQKQRLSIARALARDPKIYIFDDSFSALDFKTDAALRKALKDYTSSAAVFLIAQRVSTIINADQIIVLDEGKITGMGTHKELLKSCGVYREIAESQLSREELE